MSDILATLIYGEKKHEPVKVWVETRSEPHPWWFGNRTVYYVCTEFMSQGPYSRDGEAWEIATNLKMAMRQ